MSKKSPPGRDNGKKKKKAEKTLFDLGRCAERCTEAICPSPRALSEAFHHSHDGNGNLLCRGSHLAAEGGTLLPEAT